MPTAEEKARKAGIIGPGGVGDAFNKAASIVQDAWDPGHDERADAREAAERAAQETRYVWEGAPTKGDLMIDPNNLMGYGMYDYSLADQVHLRGPDDVYTVENRADMIQGDPTGKLAQNLGLMYYGNIAAGGQDAVAEAAYARSVAQAEQQARAQREAALQQAEMSGGSGSGAQLMADLTAGQGAAQNAWGAGMQRAADEQMRRDAAAQQFSGLGTTMRGQGLDETKAWEDAWFGTESFNAGVQNEASIGNQNALNTAEWEDFTRNNQNWDRTTNDFNQTVWHNQTQVPQQWWDNQMRGVGQYSNALQGQAAISQQQGGQPFAFGPMLAQTASNVVQSSGSPTNPYGKK